MTRIHIVVCSPAHYYVNPSSASRRDSFLSDLLANLASLSNRHPFARSTENICLAVFSKASLGKRADTQQSWKGQGERGEAFGFP